MAPREPSVPLNRVPAWEGSPSSGAGAGARVDAVTTSGPGKLFFLSFTAKCKETSWILETPASFLRSKKQSFKSSYSCRFKRGNTKFTLQIGMNSWEIT